MYFNLDIARYDQGAIGLCQCCGPAYLIVQPKVYVSSSSYLDSPARLDPHPTGNECFAVGM